MKNKSRKAIIALTLITAGSVFFGTERAEAKGLELDGIQIIFGRHHHRDAPPPPSPPPPPPGHRHDAHMFPPPPPPNHHYYSERPHMWDRRRDFRPAPPRGHMPPPPPPRIRH